MPRTTIALTAGLILGLTNGIANALPLVNASFESPTTSNIVIENTGLTPATADGWTWVGSSGILNGTGANTFETTARTGLDGSQHAYLQAGETSSSIAQGFTMGWAGIAAISWMEAGRSAALAFDGDTTYSVTAGGLTTTASTTSGSAFQSHTLTGYLTAGAYTLIFQNTSGAGDHTMYLDNVSIEVPEPRALGMLGLGLIGLAGVRFIGRSKPQQSAAAA